MVNDAISTMKKYSTFGVAVAAPIHRFPRAETRNGLYAYLLLQAMTFTQANILLACDSECKISFIVESGRKGQFSLQDVFQSGPRGIFSHHNLEFVDKNTATLLQSADLLCWSFRRYLHDITNYKIPRPDYVSLTEHPHSLWAAWHQNGSASLLMLQQPFSNISRHGEFFNAILFRTGEFSDKMVDALLKKAEARIKDKA